MKEVAAWLELREHDEFWVSKSRHAGQIFLPTTSQLLARLKDSESSLPYTGNGAEAFDALVQAIALQLLASCYTFLPASSANHLPLFQQRTGKRLVTALRAHASFRLSPAAGHHARASSETHAWPGLYTGPEPEDTLAETVSQRRRFAKRNSGYVPSFAASGWTDGANDPYRRRRGSSSSSSFETGIFRRLTCQPSTPRNPHSKHNALFSRFLFCKKKGDLDPSDKHPRKKPFQPVTTQAVQRIPSVIRLRHTESNPRMGADPNPKHPTSESSPKLVRHTSSDPSISSKFRYKLDIPEIRRTSATPNASHEVQTPFSMRGVGRGGMISAHKYPEETQMERRPSISQITRLPPIPS
ncbi:hypothetical protein BU25DRAFT_371570 [Macroventuria anomochaeta]|uniref:Uncharacterized protein n=1 Tax=Macroventuria anomochaeta TaxID=301207 RepID=A0ACB6RX49_9PLEO|nr:uncharacterized protein BU25DRAFT_371570 [Macroventuria anomochaeta]KAF2625724.1 hypothetical protein BU25DRAFT_371570 [Macroventuria anomochaeta]